MELGDCALVPLLGLAGDDVARLLGKDGLVGWLVVWKVGDWDVGAWGACGSEGEGAAGACRHQGAIGKSGGLEPLTWSHGQVGVIS